MANHTPEYSNANDWFGSLPKEKQDFLRDNKWAMVNSAFEAGRDQFATVTAQRDEPLQTVKAVQTMCHGAIRVRIDGIIAKCEVKNDGKG